MPKEQNEALVDSEKETHESTNETSNEEVQTTTEEAETTSEVDWEKEAKKWKELSRKNEAVAKSNAEKAKRLDQIEESSKTELQKAQEETERLQQEALDAIREAIAEKHGVPVDFVHGTTREDMEASAKKLQDWGAAGKQQQVPAGSGVDAAGKRGESINTDQLTRDDLKNMSAEDIEKARLAGRLDDVLGRR